MTTEEALAAFRARWDHPPLDVVDVLERVAVRGLDGYVAVALPPAVRLCRRIGTTRKGEPRWSSVYVHRLADVTGAIAVLESRAA